MLQNPATGLRVTLDPEDAERVLVAWLRDYAQSSGRPRFVLGVSGGLDSAVSAALGAKAVGASNVYGLVLPEAQTSTTDLEDAASAAKHAGIRIETQSIQPLVDSFLQVLKDPETATVSNAKARFRMVLLHAEAARRKALVLGTGNKSELLTGYFTKFGDGGVDVQPLGDLYKTQVRTLAAHLGIPARIQSKTPTAGLYQGQTDEQELGLPYEQLDRILLGLEIHFPPARIAEIVGVSVDEVARIERLRSKTQHKRRAALVPKIGLRTTGLDWRASTLEG